MNFHNSTENWKNPKVVSISKGNSLQPHYFTEWFLYVFVVVVALLA